MRKLIAVLLMMAILLGLASTAMAVKPKTLEIYWIANAVKAKEAEWAPVREGVEEAINEYIEPLINANVHFHLVNWDDWETDALQPLLNDERIDLIFTADWRDYVQEINADKLVALDADVLLSEYGPDIIEGPNALSADFLDGVRYGKSQLIYGIPTNKELCVPTGLLVNKTAALEIGWDPEKDPVRSTEELEPWLEKYKARYPDKYPYLMEKGRWSDEPWNHEWIGIEEDALSMKYAKQEDGTFDETVYSIYETPEQEAHIRLMYAWAQKGYIAPDAATYNYNEIFGTGDFLVFTQPLKGNNIKAVEMYTANHPDDLPPFECVEIILQDKYKVTTQAGGSMFAIPMSAKYKEKAMQYLNLMHSDETLVNLMLFGKEGVNYNKVNDRQVEKIDDAHWWYGLHGGAWTVGNTKLQYVLTDEDPDKNALLQEFAVGAPKTASYGFRFDKTKAPKLVDAVKDAAAKFARPLMVGAVDPDDPELGLEAFRKALKDAGIDELKTEVERQYNEWKDWMK